MAKLLVLGTDRLRQPLLSAGVEEKKKMSGISENKWGSDAMRTRTEVPYTSTSSTSSCRRLLELLVYILLWSGV